MNAPQTIPRATVLDALRNLGLDDLGSLLAIRIDGAALSFDRFIERDGERTIETTSYRVVDECPSCHTADGHPHTEYCRREHLIVDLVGTQQPVDRRGRDDVGMCTECGASAAERHAPACRWSEHDVPPEVRELAERMIADEIANDPDAVVVLPRPWVDNGCRCPNPDHEHLLGCPALCNCGYSGKPDEAHASNCDTNLPAEHRSGPREP